MNISSIYKIYFSATGTTRKVVDAIGDKLAHILNVNTHCHDFTLPSARLSFPDINPDSIVVFGVPTYAGRVPNVLLKYLDAIQGNGSIAVPIVTFGNRAFDNALIELRNILEKHDFKTMAGAAFVAEHSFSTVLAAGRPDTDDIAFAEKFADDIVDKISKTENIGYHEPIMVDGDADAFYFQPKTDDGRPIDIRKVKPKTDGKCVKCGLCSRICPMGSISSEDFSIITGICIKCGACIKKCPAQAKYFDDPDYLYHKKQLEERYSRRAENKVFI